MPAVRSLRQHWRPIVALLMPLLLSPMAVPASDRSSESRCAFMVLLMASFWITEVLPLPVTSLLPVALCPLLGIQSTKEACKVFFVDLSFLVIGSLSVAIAIEKSMLHKRIALTVLNKLGVQPRRLMLGVMLITACLSMWINNTAAAAMMMPITSAVLERLFQNETETETKNSEEKLELQQEVTQLVIGDTGNSSGDAVETKEGTVAGAECFRNTSRPEEDPDVEVISHATNVFSGPPSWEEMQAQDRPESYKLLNTRSTLDNPRLDTDVEVISLRSYGQHKSPDLDRHTDGFDGEKQGKGPSSQFTIRVFGLCVAYSANIGGIATLTGSPPNLVLGQAVNSYSGRSEINFAKWLAFGFPVSMICLALAYLCLNIYLFGLKDTLTLRTLSTKEKLSSARAVVRQELEKMGPIKFNEKIVLVHFLALVLLWLTRRPGFAPGWSYLFSDGFVTDGFAATAVAVSLFILPDQRPAVFCFRRKGEDSVPRAIPSVLSWKLVSKKMPWGVLFLFGGGLVVAQAVQVSGLSQAITSYLLVVRHMPAWAACLAMTCFTCVITELSSNTVIAILIMPILKNMASVLEVHPLYLMFPATISTSMAFMLPVATPPNALVYSFGQIRLSDMIKCGSVLNVIGVGVILLATHTWGWAAFDLGSVPQWGRQALSPAAGANSSSVNNASLFGAFGLIEHGNQSYSNYSVRFM